METDFSYFLLRLHIFVPFLKNYVCVYILNINIEYNTFL